MKKQIKAWAVYEGEDAIYPFPKVYAVSQTNGKVVQPTCIFISESLAKAAANATARMFGVIPITISYEVPPTRKSKKV